LKIIEDKKTAKEPGREGFAEMIKMITRKEADVVIVWEMSRIARNPIDS
jgi:DNA invertase Pin-like site-specific DNA recombinase